jgi:signal transduction histidine kinase/PAS domain-containing protein
VGKAQEELLGRSIWKNWFFSHLKRVSIPEKVNKMGESPQPVKPSKRRSGRTPVGRTPVKKRVPRSPSAKTKQKSKVPFKQAEAILEAFPESVIACDRDRKILWINAAARKLFEVPSQASCQGTGYQQFLEHYTHSDQQQQCVAREQWLMNLVLNKEVASSSPESPPILHLPSGREVAVTCWDVPVDDAHKHLLGTAYTFHDLTHCHQKALQIQRVHEAVLTLTAAIAQIPEQINLAWSEETLLLSPPVVFVAQQLVEVIHCVLDCRRVSLLASQPLAGSLYYVAGSGFTAEQEQLLREKGGEFLPSEVVDETALARLSANQEVILASGRLRRRLVRPAEGDPENLLMVPLFLEQQWAGTLTVVKAGGEGEYSPEEVEVVKAVAAQVTLVIEGLRCLHAQTETRTRALVLQEVQRLSNDFLTMASHELRTPLTGIMGNLQLAQHRLETLKRQVAAQAEHVREHLTYAQRPLASASQSARLLQRMIADLIDDARIQTNELALSLQPCDLLALLKEAVATQQHDAPERMIVIVLERIPTEHTVPILADAQRITQVLTTYLTNALRSTPGARPVTVKLTVEDAVARVSVHDEGAGIPAEEQAHLWDRFYRGKGSTVQHELDLSLGLGLYLCQALIERHQGKVGVQSAPGQGTTFWFTLPLAK